VTGEATYTAKFNRIPNKYTVTWVNDDDTVLEVDENVVFGATPSYDGETPTKAATAQFTYTFAGWTPDILPVAKDIVYKATYGAEVNEYVVTWYDDDKETILNQQTLPFGTMPEYHGEVPVKAATKEYTFTFAGWDPEMVPVAGDAAYVAVYLAKPIPVQQTQPPLTPEERSARMNRKFKVYYDEAPKATKGEPALVVEWGRTSGVSSYELFVSYMDEDAPIEPTVTLKANAFAAYFTELNGEKIDFTRCFAVYVVAKNWRGEEIGRTEIAYVAGPDSEYTNPASLTVTSEKSIRLSVGESSTIQAVVTLEDDARPEIPDVPAFRYACTRNNVVTISADGTITAVGRGSCVIQVYSKNVLVDEIKVTVR
jgi:hypothetical protein